MFKYGFKGLIFVGVFGFGKIIMIIVLVECFNLDIVIVVCFNNVLDIVWKDILVWVFKKF